MSDDKPLRDYFNDNAFRNEAVMATLEGLDPFLNALLATTLVNQVLDDMSRVRALLDDLLDQPMSRVQATVTLSTAIECVAMRDFIDMALDKFSFEPERMQRGLDQFARYNVKEVARLETWKVRAQRKDERERAERQEEAEYLAEMFEVDVQQCLDHMPEFAAIEAEFEAEKERRLKEAGIDKQTADELETLFDAVLTGRFKSPEYNAYTNIEADVSTCEHIRRSQVVPGPKSTLPLGNDTFVRLKVATLDQLRKSLDHLPDGALKDAVRAKLEVKPPQQED
jgi:hypothetical protein